MEASRRGNVEIVEMLIATGESRPAHTDVSGWTALFFAAFNWRVEVVQVLLATGESLPRSVDCDGQTAITIAYAHPVISRMIQRRILLEEFQRRRFTQWSVLRTMRQTTNFARPGSNTMVHNLGAVLSTLAHSQGTILLPATMDELGDDLVDVVVITPQLYASYREGHLSRQCISV
jgi:hypothetical protein